MNGNNDIQELQQKVESLEKMINKLKAALTGEIEKRPELKQWLLLLGAWYLIKKPWVLLAGLGYMWWRGKQPSA